MQKLLLKLNQLPTNLNKTLQVFKDPYVGT